MATEFVAEVVDGLSICDSAAQAREATQLLARASGSYDNRPFWPHGLIQQTVGEPRYDDVKKSPSV